MQAKLDPPAHAALGRLARTLAGRAGLPTKVDRQDLLSAVVLYTTPPQAAWMLAEYWRYSALALGPVGEESEDDADDGE